MSDGSEKTHVLTSDCIISEIGRCEAGMMIGEEDVVPTTWQWLLDRNFIRSVESIESEADADDESSDGQTTEEQKSEESTTVETANEPVKETPGSSDVTEESKQAGRRTRK